MSYMRTLLRRYNVLNQRKNPKVLDAHNDTLKDKYLHPTKGYRKVSFKRTRVTLMTAEIKNGRRPWAMTLVQQEIKLLEAAE